jgi:hypothetical protein
MANTIFDAIQNSSSRELEELAAEIWMAFDLRFSESTECGVAGETAEKGNVMEVLLEAARRKAAN